MSKEDVILKDSKSRILTKKIVCLINKEMQMMDMMIMMMEIQQHLLKLSIVLPQDYPENRLK